jgi:hypothetical protein
MGTITQLIPAQVLHRFLRQQVRSNLLVVSVSGPHAYGYPSPTSPLEVKGLHVEPTESLVGLTQPPKAINWVGEYEGHSIDYSSEELGEGLRKLLKGDGSILERILSPRPMLKGDDLRRLQKVTRGVLSRRFFTYYRSFSRGVLRDYEGSEQRTVRHLLGAYRLALTGVHLLGTGKVVVDLMTLAREYGFSQISELTKVHQKDAGAVLDEGSQWINRLVRLHSLLDRSMEQSELPADPDDPAGLEEYLLDMRRRFFDAHTLQER